MKYIFEKFVKFIFDSAFFLKSKKERKLTFYLLQNEFHNIFNFSIVTREREKDRLLRYFKIIDSPSFFLI